MFKDSILRYLTIEERPFRDSSNLESLLIEPEPEAMVEVLNGIITVIKFLLIAKMNTCLLINYRSFWTCGEISDETLTWWPDQGDNWNGNLLILKASSLLSTQNRRSAWMIIQTAHDEVQQLLDGR